MSTLERHCRMLLLAYPAAYRRERGEEILGTLLETTPDGRTWPLPRDIRALVVSGLRARGAQNCALTTGASLRLAALFGVAIYLSFYVNTVGYGALFPRWSAIAANLLVSATILAAWIARPTIVVFAAIAAGIAYCASVSGLGRSVVLPALAALVLLARGHDRPPRLWLWLPGLAIAAPALALLFGRVFHWYPGVLSIPGHQLYWIILTVAVVVAWLATDPRPAFALAVYLGLWLADQLILFLTGPLPVRPGFPSRADVFFGAFACECLAAGTVLAALALWRFRRRPVI
jgi:hypothetical protein